MTIKKFKVTMQVEKEMVISVDTDQINDKFFQEFSSYMWKVNSYEEVCEHIGHSIMFNDLNYVEGVATELCWHKPDESMKDYGVSISRVEDLMEEFEVVEL